MLTKGIKIFFFIFFCFNGSAIIITIVWVVSDILLGDSINVVTLISTLISIVMFICSRYFYRKKILYKITIS